MSRTVASRPTIDACTQSRRLRAPFRLNLRSGIVQGYSSQTNIHGAAQMSDHGLGIDRRIQLSAFARGLFLGAANHKRQALKELEVLAAASVLREQVACLSQSARRRPQAVAQS